MKSKRFWIIRFLWVLASAFFILFGVELAKGHAVGDAALNASVWALISATIFICTRYYYASKNIACAMCRDTVED